MSTPEGPLVKACLQYLGLRGIMAWRQNTGAFVGEHKGKRRFVKFSVKGAGDIFAILPDGRFWSIECKVKPNKPTYDQWSWMAQVDAAGGYTTVAYTVDDVMDALNETEK